MAAMRSKLWKQGEPYCSQKGEELEVAAHSEPVRIVLFMGKPLQEPIAWGGPIVMNTSEELEEAFREIREGTFVELR